MSESNVVTANRWQAVVARARHPRRRLEVLLADPAAAMIVPQMPAEEFYYLVKAVGVHDVGELLALASPDQLRTCIDLDAWDGDRLALDRLVPWVEALEHLDGERVAAVVRRLDIELLSLIYSQVATIREPEAERAEEPLRGRPVFETPDGHFIVEFTGVELEQGRVLERFLALFYTADPDHGRDVLLEASVGLPSELEESSLRWRTARLADLGFVDYYDALEVYRYVDLATLRQTSPAAPPRRAEPMGLPAVFAHALADEIFLTRVLGTIEEAGPLNAVTNRLVVLLNRVLSADRIGPADTDAVERTVARARDTLSLGLEVLADGDLDRGRATIERLGMVELFRAGFSLTVDLQRRAKALRAAGVDDPDLLPLIAARPQYPRALDDPPFAGERPFRTPLDLQRVAARLDALAATPAR